MTGLCDVMVDMTAELGNAAVAGAGQRSNALAKSSMQTIDRESGDFYGDNQSATIYPGLYGRQHGCAPFFLFNPETRKAGCTGGKSPLCQAGPGAETARAEKGPFFLSRYH